MQRVSYNDGGLTISNTTTPVVNIYDTTGDAVLVKLSGSLSCDSVTANNVTASNLTVTNTVIQNLQVTNLTALSSITCNTLSALTSLTCPSISGTISTANQTNITQIGPLTSLTVETVNATTLNGQIGTTNQTGSVNFSNIQGLTATSALVTSSRAGNIRLDSIGTNTNNAISATGADTTGINFPASGVNIAASGNNIINVDNNRVFISRPISRGGTEYTTSPQTITMSNTTPRCIFISNGTASSNITITLPANTTTNQGAFLGVEYFIGKSTSAAFGVVFSVPSGVILIDGATQWTNTTSTVYLSGIAGHVTLACLGANVTNMVWFITGARP